MYYKINTLIYIMGLLTGVILISGFRNNGTAITVIGSVMCFLAVIGLAVKIYRFYKEFK